MHKSNLWNWVFMLWALLIFAISASTTFAFFMKYFSGWMPEGILDPWLSSLLSGVIGVTLFDFAAVTWLYTFLLNAETSEQRAISIGMTFADFLCAAAASVAYLGLTATGELALSQTTKDTVGLIALIVVIIGVVLNFGSGLAYTRYDKDTKQDVREAERKDRIAKTLEKAQQELDKEVARKMEQEINDLADEITRTQSAKLTQGFYDIEKQRFETQVMSQTQTKPMKEVLEQNARKCLYCGERLTGHKRKYCDEVCRDNYHRAKS